MTASSPARPLAALLPPPQAPLTADEAFERFLRYPSEAGLTLYPAQEEAILELFGGNHVFLKTPTGSGKSLVALALHFHALAMGRPSVYTAPVKALVNEKFFALCELFGPERVGLLTGDASINSEAPILCCTAEILANRCLQDATYTVDAVVMDEFHYYADRERGVAWQIPLLSLPRTQFLLMSATLGDTRGIEESLVRLSGRAVKEIGGAQRPVPLRFEYRETPLHETLADLVATGRAPVYLVNFTQRAAAEHAQSLTSVEVTTREGKDAIRVALAEARFDTPYGKDLQRFLRHGIGLHHAGLLPRYRRLVERLAQTGLLKVISGTDTLGVGVNIPIRTVLLTQLTKFNGEKTAVLSVRDFLQIAGRAGRKGFDEEGFVVAQAPEHVIENLRLERKAATGKKVVKQKPPEGYVHYDRLTFDRLVSGTPEPLESRFDVTHGMILNLLQGGAGLSGGGYRRLVRLIGDAHERDARKKHFLKRARLLTRALVHAGVVQAHRREPGHSPRLEVNVELQDDFSLHQTLSLFLLTTLEKLDPTSEAHALDVVSLTESILENPNAVLYAQLDRLKRETLAELKARGVEYAERIEELDKLEWPKPLADFLYAHFNDFAAVHPWLGQENIRPKSVARELLEGFAAFNDYVREYGLQRSEGVLLRYLSEVYRVLARTVPEAARTDLLEDAIASLRTLIRGVDSSLLDEWEGMTPPTGAPVPIRVIRARPIEEDPRAFAARVRSELHALLRALAQGSWEAAQACIHDPDGEWSEERLAAEMSAFSATHGAIRLTPDVRRPEHTRLVKEAPRRWSVQQRIFTTTPDASNEDDGFLDCEVNLEIARPEGAPLLSLRRVGS